MKEGAAPLEPRSPGWPDGTDGNARRSHVRRESEERLRSVSLEKDRVSA